MTIHLLKTARGVLSEAVSAFGRNNGFSAASSLAFSATLALIPALFLLTFVLGAVIGSSGRALAQTQELLTQLIPAYSQDILREVRLTASHMKTIGVLNSLVLLWSVTPLVADLRVLLGTVFRKRRARPFLLEKLFDVAVSITFLVALSLIAVAGVLITLAEKKSGLRMDLGYAEEVALFVLVTGVIAALYALFSKGAHLRHLAAGAFCATLLWFSMRPIFHWFITYNPGYGFAFGSFKSLFVVVVWIYCSQVVFLFGAEIAASLGRGETVFIKKLMEGSRNVPAGIIDKYVAFHERGSVVFQEGDPGSTMYCVLKGTVAIRRGEREVGLVREGACFGAMSFLLSAPRAARAVAVEDTELVAIGNENINDLMNEYPEFIVSILRETALRLRETSTLAD